MRFNRILLAAVSLSIIGTSAADAACSKAAMAGVWYFYDIQGQSPAIATKDQSVVVGPKLTDHATVTVFQNGSTAFQNNTSAAITCTINIKATGSLTGACTSYFAQPGSIGSQSPNITGQLNVTAACAVTGTINVQGDPDVVTIVAAHANGNVGAGGVVSGVATQTNQVHHFTLIRN